MANKFFPPSDLANEATLGGGSKRPNRDEIKRLRDVAKYYSASVAIQPLRSVQDGNGR